MVRVFVKAAGLSCQHEFCMIQGNFPVMSQRTLQQHRARAANFGAFAVVPSRMEGAAVERVDGLNVRRVQCLPKAVHVFFFWFVFDN